MPVVYFDASRLFLRAGRASPTGIDRVVFAYARWLRSLPGLSLVPVWSRMGYLSRLSTGRFDRIIDALNSRERASAVTSGPTWDGLVAALRDPDERRLALRPSKQAGTQASEIKGYASAVLSALGSPGELRLQRNALFFNVNHFGLEHPLLLKRLAGAGVRPVILIHDLIPVNYPEFCSPGGAARHRRRIENTVRYAELVIANSLSTVDELTRFASINALSTPKCVCAPLGLEDAFLRPDVPAVEAPPYFVCVGTIEPRKNLSFLLSVWRGLAERLGPDTPRLVLVGRRGWENEAIVDQLERSPPILTHVHEVNNLSDHQVARLIRGAAALLSPSFAEGYNLPVMEARALGAPVIASDIPVHRELAADAQLIDALDGPGWVAAITAACTTPPARRLFDAPTWNDHFASVAAAVGFH